MITITIQPQTPAHMRVLANVLADMLASDYEPPRSVGFSPAFAAPYQEPVKADAPAKAEAPKPVKAPKAEKPAPTPAASETVTTETTPVATAPSEPAVVSPSEPKPLTLEEVRAKLSALSAIGKAAVAKQIIADTGHIKLTEVPVSFYAEMAEKADKAAA